MLGYGWPGGWDSFFAGMLTLVILIIYGTSPWWVRWLLESLA